MLRSRIAGLVDGLRSWYAYRSLIAVACRNDLDRATPDRIARTIQRFAHSRLYREPQRAFVDYARDPRPLTCKHALMRIWELSEVQAQRSNCLRFKWRRIMAMCSALYAKFETPRHQQALR